MACALIVEGPFDDWLKWQWTVPLVEKVMVVQQVHDLNFYEPASAAVAPTALINGQLMPQVTMYPGQIQRWRVVAATMEASAQLTIDFDGPSNSSGVQVKQIAMDGIQLAPLNYQNQPLIDYPSKTFRLSPGNRADFLVKAPAQVGRFLVTYDVFGRVESQGTRRRQQSGKGKPAPTREDVLDVLEALAPKAAQPGLLSINVVPCPAGQKCPPMAFPATLPDLPPSLADIDEIDGSHDVLFSLTDGKGGLGGPGAQPQVFAIGVDGTAPQQFRGDCAAFTEPLERREEWSISQNQNNFGGKPFHVFHIHTNPFQVIQNGADANGNPIIYNPPIWMDSITLPDIDDNSTDDQRKIVMRTKYEDYTGAYVLHCHFLGHEDRGMMLTVQTVCPDNPTAYGTPNPNGGADDCSVPIAKALLPCPTTPAAAPASTRVRMKKQ